MDRLSGGQRALVALALAVGEQADLLVLDDPLMELDPLAHVHVVCDDLILLDSGQVQLCGSITDLLDTQPATTMARSSSPSAPSSCCPARSH